MYLLSYRGPSAAGGISSALEALWTHPASSAIGWWYMSDGSLVHASSASRPVILHNFPDEMVEGHYRFCNEFIWPLVHGFDAHVNFDAADCRHYKDFQQMTARTIGRRIEKNIFIHDYQFAFLPASFANSTFFWHIPWPHPLRVNPVWLPFLKEMAAQMAKAVRIGFHTAEYAKNFLLCFDEDIRHSIKAKVVEAPLPIDHELWYARSNESSNTLADTFSAIRRPYILSVDRADYAKGILERFDAIDLLFERHSYLKGKFVFAQLCHRSRSGITCFDEYWEACRHRHQQLNERWSTDGWAPSVWIDESYNGEQLSRIYEHAHALLVTSIADGLNLTAKEFVACQKGSDAAVIVSKGAGVSRQLHPHCFSFRPTSPMSFLNALSEALVCTSTERKRRMEEMHQLIEAEDLLVWSKRFDPTFFTLELPLSV